MPRDIIDEFYSVLREREAGKAPDQKSFSGLIEAQAEKLGLSQRQLADALNIERRSLQRILNGEAQKVDVLTFLKLRHFLDLDAKDLLDIYTAGLEPDGLRELRRAQVAGFIVRNFDVDGLKKANFISSVTDFEAIEARITSFFGFDSIFEYDNSRHIPLFSRTQRQFSSKMLRFWVNSALYQIGLVQNPHLFNRDMLLKMIPSLRTLTRDVENGLLRAARALYSVGVTVIVQHYLTGTQIRGATFVVDGKPAIVLTDFNKRYDTLWFALLHELYHVLKDMEVISQLGYHLTGEPDLFVNEMSEEDADSFASEFLLAKDKRNYIRSFIDVPGMVDDYAAKWNVHPSIVYGSYMWQHGEYEKFVRFIPKPDVALKALRIHPWEKETLKDAVVPIKEAYEPK